MSTGAGVGCILALAGDGGAHSGWWLWSYSSAGSIDDNGVMVVIDNGNRWW